MFIQGSFTLSESEAKVKIFFALCVLFVHNRLDSPRIHLEGTSLSRLLSLSVNGP